MPHKIYYFKTLTSTQDKAKEFSKKGLSNIVIVADTQTKGRGRFNRKWYSSIGGLWFSILLKPKNINPQYLTFIAAIAVVKSIKKLANLDASIKWPNDVHYKGKKLCGILTEGIFGMENYVIVGIGLNINQSRFPNEIRDIATSLRIIRKKILQRKIFLKNILNEFEKLYLYGNNKVIPEWKKYCDTIGKKVIAITKNKKFKGTAVDVDNECRLILELNNGKIIRIVEGDLVVKK